MTITLLTDSNGNKMGKTAGKAVWLDPNKTSPFDFYQSVSYTHLDVYKRQLGACVPIPGW